MIMWIYLFYIHMFWTSRRLVNVGLYLFTLLPVSIDNSYLKYPSGVRGGLPRSGWTRSPDVSTFPILCSRSSVFMNIVDRLRFHRQQYQLGDHYNSVISKVSATETDWRIHRFCLILQDISCDWFIDLLVCGRIQSPFFTIVSVQRHYILIPRDLVTKFNESTRSEWQAQINLAQVIRSSISWREVNQIIGFKFDFCLIEKVVWRYIFL
jgi:hypothetical protein